MNTSLEIPCQEIYSRIRQRRGFSEYFIISGLQSIVYLKQPDSLRCLFYIVEFFSQGYAFVCLFKMNTQKKNDNPRSDRFIRSYFLLFIDAKQSKRRVIALNAILVIRSRQFSIYEYREKITRQNWRIYLHCILVFCTAKNNLRYVAYLVILIIEAFRKNLTPNLVFPVV